MQWLVPEAPHIYSANLNTSLCIRVTSLVTRCHLWVLQDPGQTPHQGPVHPHQLLVIHHVSLVQHNADLVIVTPQSLNTPPELIANVQLVGVKQQQYPETRNYNLTSIF